MISIWVPLALALLLLAAGGFCFWCYRRYRLEKVDHSLVLGSVDVYRQLLEQLRDSSTEEIERLRKQRDLHMDKNQEFERQRDEIWRLYRDSGIRAGNAQEWLLNDLQVAYGQLNTLRKNGGLEAVKINPALKTLVETFKQEHGSGRSDVLGMEALEKKNG